MIYLDFAATSALRPPEVADAVAGYLRDVGATPGRGSYGRAVEAGRVALRCRQALAGLLGIPGDPGRIAFMLNATHALNTAMWGVLAPGEAVVTTALDHNAVRRPARALSGERGIEVRVIPASAAGELDLDAARRAIAGARLVVINGASNVLGVPLPVRQLAALARDAGALTLLDAAQMAGHVPTDVARLDVDMVALTGHKALLGPQGVGALWVRDGIDVAPLLRGGSGGDSLLPDMPEAMPDRLEAGTQNAPGIAGLLAGVEWLEARGVAELAASLEGLAARLHGGLAALDGVRVLSPMPRGGAPIVSWTADDVDPAEMALRLDRLGVCVRSGLHCAPDTHVLLGTERTGAVRMSLGWATSERDVDEALAAVRSALAGRPREARGGTMLQRNEA
mgnify:CR=1 FL=1